MEDWAEALDTKSGRTYYFNQKTGDVRWHKPIIVTVAPPPPPPLETYDLPPPPIEIHYQQQPVQQIQQQSVSDWTPMLDPKGRTYYYNNKTGESQWTLPANNILQHPPSSSSQIQTPPPQNQHINTPPPPQVQIPQSPWVEALDPNTQRKYWYNTSTGETSWSNPSASSSASSSSSSFSNHSNNSNHGVSSITNQLSTSSLNSPSTANKTLPGQTVIKVYVIGGSYKSIRVDAGFQVKDLIPHMGEKEHIEESNRGNVSDFHIVSVIRGDIDKIEKLENELVKLEEDKAKYEARLKEFAVMYHSRSDLREEEERQLSTCRKKIAIICEELRPLVTQLYPEEEVAAIRRNWVNSPSLFPPGSAVKKGRSDSQGSITLGSPSSSGGGSSRGSFLHRGSFSKKPSTPTSSEDPEMQERVFLFKDMTLLKKYRLAGEGVTNVNPSTSSSASLSVSEPKQQGTVSSEFLKSLASGPTKDTFPVKVHMMDGTHKTIFCDNFTNVAVLFLRVAEKMGLSENDLQNWAVVEVNQDDVDILRILEDMVKKEELELSKQEGIVRHFLQMHKNQPEMRAEAEKAMLDCRTKISKLMEDMDKIIRKVGNQMNVRELRQIWVQQGSRTRAALSCIDEKKNKKKDKNDKVDDDEKILFLFYHIATMLRYNIYEVDKVSALDLVRGMTASAVTGAALVSVSVPNNGMNVNSLLPPAPLGIAPPSLLSAPSTKSQTENGVGRSRLVTVAAPTFVPPPPENNNISKDNLWRRIMDEKSQKYYYVHVSTGETTWTQPTEF